MNNKIKGLCLAGLSAALIGCGNGEEPAGDAREWPHDSLTIIVPFDAGGSVDTLARGINEHLPNHLDVRVEVENRPGASTQIGTAQFLNSPDDGTYAFAGTQLYYSSTVLLQDADYEIDDLSMVNFEQFDPITITVPEDSPYQTFEQLVEAMQEEELSYSTIYGGTIHLTGVLLADRLDVQLNPVFYDGGGEMRNALLGGHVDFMIGNAAGDTAIADQVRVLAIAEEEEHELWPEAEPMNEVLEQYDAEVPYIGSYRYLSMHKSFKEENPELFQELTEAYEEMFQSEEYQELLDDLGTAPVSEIMGADESDQTNRELHELMEEYEEEMQ